MIELIPVGKLYVDPSYQRPESMSRIRAIADNFAPDLLQVLEVSRRENGVNAVIDGQTRMKAAKIKHGSDYELQARVLTGLTVPQEADLFVKFQRQRKALSPIELYTASLVAGDALSKQVYEILARRGLKVGAGGRPGTIAAVTALIECVKRSPDGLERNLDILRAAWGDDSRTFSRLNIRGMQLFLQSYPHAKTDRLVKVLSVETPESVERKVKILMGAGGGGGNHTVPYVAIFRDLYNKKLRAGALGKVQIDLDSVPKGELIDID